MEPEIPANTVTTENAVFTVPNPQPPARPAVDLSDPAIAAIIEKVRKEEKDKLYPELQETKSQFSSLQKTVQELQAQKQAEIDAAAAQARAEAEDAARKQWEENDSKTLLQNAQSEWEKKFEALAQDRANERAAFEKEREFAALQQYTQSRVAEALQENQIAPELQHLVVGNTREEIDASLENVRATTDALAASMQQALQAAQAQKRGVSPTGYAAVGPMDLAETSRTLSAADLRDMPMHEYAKIRASLPGINQNQTTRGLFG